MTSGGNNHDNFRRKEGSWYKCIEALYHCKEAGLGVVINIVATKSLIISGELVRQLEFVEQFDEHTSIIFVKPVGAFEGSEKEMLDSRDIKLIQRLTKLYNCSTHLSPNFGREFGCMCFKRHFSITAYGDVLPCPWIPIRMGNIRDEPLETIVQRGLSNKWFSYDRKYTCLSGNRDSEFHQKIIPQIKDYPTDRRDIEW